MNNKIFQFYLESVVSLVQTLRIKSEYTAKKINEYVRDFHGFHVDETNPATWKYYLNLCGEYHPTDPVIKIVSLDNQEEIIFNKENLKYHRRTYREYRFNTRLYNVLLKTYPNHEDLILGILYPAEMSEAISAPDHTILAWNKHLIEDNEHSLVESLQKWTDVYFKRYYNEQYSISDSLYEGVVLSMYYMNLIPVILIERLKRHKTMEAHSFYVKSYLESHSDLGKVYPFMTHKQVMHFYRNIKYYQRNSGTNDTFEKLTDALLTHRGIPLAEYDLEHNHEKQIDDIYPELTFRYRDRTRITSSNLPEYSNLDTILQKESGISPGNSDVILEDYDSIEMSLKDSPSGIVETKILESSMVDMSKSVTYQLDKIQVAHWLYYAHKGLYKAYAAISNHRTGETISMPMKDAYTLCIYCLYRSFDMDIDYIPVMGAERVLRYPAPTEESVKSKVLMEYIDDFTWNTLQDSIVHPDYMISVDSFYEYTDRIAKSANKQRELVAFQEGMHSRAEVFRLIDNYYEDAYIRTEPAGTRYADWLLAHKLDFENWTQDDFQQLYENIVSECLGTDVNTTPSMRNIQKHMLEAMGMLNSYTIQYVSRIADEKTISMSFPSIRSGNNDISAENDELIKIGYLDVLSQSVNAEHVSTLNSEIALDNIERSVYVENYLYIDINVSPVTSVNDFRDIEHIRSYRIRQSAIEVSVVDKPDTGNTGLPPILGMDKYLSLTPEQKLSILN